MKKYLTLVLVTSIVSVPLAMFAQNISLIPAITIVCVAAASATGITASLALTIVLSALKQARNNS